MNNRKHDRKFNYANPADQANIKRIVHFMPSYALADGVSDEFLDVYYDTPEGFLKNIDASLRVRQRPNAWELTIRHKIPDALEAVDKNDMYRVYSQSVAVEKDFTKNPDVLFFIEDKLNESFSHRLKIDVLRILKSLKPILAVKTESIDYKIINNKQFEMHMSFEYVSFQTRKHKDTDEILKFTITSFPSLEALEHYNKIIDEIRKKVVLIELSEEKYDTGHRMLSWPVLNDEYDLGDEEEDEDLEEEEDED